MQLFCYQAFVSMGAMFRGIVTSFHKLKVESPVSHYRQILRLVCRLGRDYWISRRHKLPFYIEEEWIDHLNTPVCRR